MQMQRLVLMALLVVAALAGAAAHAQLTGHYPVGSEGLKGATLPPPGLYLKNYLQYYNANVYRDSRGENNGWDLDLDVLAFAPRLLWMTNQEILGADYGMDVLLPLVYTDIAFNSVPTPGGDISIGDNMFCAGDLLVEPIDLAWHAPRYDIGLAFGVWMPTGRYDPHRLASPGKDFWTAMFTYGGTLYLDAERTWHASALGRYEIHSCQDHNDARPGQDTLVEWGVGKTLAKVWDLGVVGYAQWQLTDDSGRDVTWDKDVHDRVAAVGPEVSYVIPPLKTIISARCNFEFSAVDRPEGTNVVVTITKAF